MVVNILLHSLLVNQSLNFNAGVRFVFFYQSDVLLKFTICDHSIKYVRKWLHFGHIISSKMGSDLCQLTGARVYNASLLVLSDIGMPADHPGLNSVYASILSSFVDITFDNTSFEC
jgi:hypothetical protein